MHIDAERLAPQAVVRTGGQAAITGRGLTGGWRAWHGFLSSLA